MIFLTPDEYGIFLNCFRAWRRPLVTLLFTTGLRWGEASALKVSDFQINDKGLGTLTIVRAWKDDGKTLGPPKTPKSRRTITLAPEMATIIKGIVKGKKPSDWIFTAANGVDRVKYHTFKDHWITAINLANGNTEKAIWDGKRLMRPPKEPLGKEPRIHDARHSAASWMLGAGTPINWVQAHLGHESITTTVDRYGHVMPGAGAAIAAAISIAISPTHPELEPEPLQLEKPA
jgi:integrase